MGQIMLRNLDERVMKRLEKRALRKGNTLEDEIREILKNTADFELRLKTSPKRFMALQKSIGARQFSDSTKIVRQHRDGK